MGRRALFAHSLSGFTELHGQWSVVVFVFFVFVCFLA